MNYNYFLFFKKNEMNFKPYIITIIYVTILKMTSLPKKVLRDIEMMGAYDPLIIKLNRNMFWTENHYDICCREATKVDENYIEKGKAEQNPKSLSYDKRCKLRSKIKYIYLKT